MHRYLLLILSWCLLTTLAARAQGTWATTQLSDDATVELPYEPSPDSDPKYPGIKSYELSTGDNQYQVLSMDLRYMPEFDPNADVSVKGLSKFFDKMSRKFGHQVFRGKIVSQGNVMFAGSPARAAMYRGFDHHRQQTTHIETVWVWRGDAVYLFACTYRLPEDASATADKKRFFSSVRFGERFRTQEL